MVCNEPFFPRPMAHWIPLADHPYGGKAKSGSQLDLSLIYPFKIKSNFKRGEPKKNQLFNRDYELN